ncbi:MAG: tRNA dihydrouridine(20/20a) synthase DusA, partial [Kiloniellales bacterium]
MTREAQTKMEMPDHRLSVAPMMDRTDRHDRFFLRLISRRVLLYTEMITTGAILHGDRRRLLAHDPCEHPLALQVGGAEPADLGSCARIAEAYGYDEVNLNVGCPSDRVRQGRFGASLMAEPGLVADAVKAMLDAAAVPVTVKSRIGIDGRDSYDHLAAFVATVAAAGCRSFTIHARKAVLGGLSPKQNREVPPLRYLLVYRLKREFPELEVVVNGGVEGLDAAEAHLRHVDGVMIGRAAYEDPYMLAEADRRLFATGQPVPSRHDVIEALIPYVERRLAEGAPLNGITRHILGLFNGVPGSRAWRRHLSQHAHRPDAGAEIIREAAAMVP